MKKHKKARWRKRDNPYRNIRKHPDIIDCSKISEEEEDKLGNEFVTCRVCNYTYGKYAISGYHGNRYLIQLDECPSCSGFIQNFI